MVRSADIIHVAVHLHTVPVSAQEIIELVREARSLGIVVFTIGIRKSGEDYVDSLDRLFNELATTHVFHDLQAKVSVYGKWYALAHRVVDPIKKVLDATKEYEQFYINFCVEYDGNDEIVDATRLIAQQVQMGRIDPQAISTRTIKENCYTSSIISPQLIIQTGPRPSLGGFLLWDSRYAHIHFHGATGITGKDLRKIVEKEKNEAR